MSKSSRFEAVLVFAVAAAIVGPRVATSAPPAKDAKTTTKESFSVVQVDAEYQVVRKSELKAFQKGLNDKYASDVKSHAAARKAAAQAKEKFTQPAPVKPKVKTLSKTFDSEEAASAYVQELKDADEKKRAAANPPKAD